MSDPAEPVDLAALRQDYGGRPFDVTDLAPTWDEQFDRWFAEASAAGVYEPNAMVLATVDDQGRPATRSVLAKGVDARGVVFYTNETSAKGRAVQANPVASVTFPWYLVHRQITIRGNVERVDAATTLDYWRTRPRESKIGAWASPQSSVVADRAALDALTVEVEARFAGVDEIPVPPFWGGFRIVPVTVEFWQGRTGRLHDRLRFRTDIDADPDDDRERGDDGTASGGAGWVVERLAP